MTPRAALIFAAGFGTRMGDLTRDQPKPLIRVGGKTLLNHALEPVQQAGISRIVVNTHYRAGMIADHLAATAPEVALSHEVEILETGGGLRHALPHLGAGPVITLNSDAVWRGPNPIKALCQNWDPGRMDALLLCVPRTRAIGHSGAGDFRMDQGRLLRGGDLVYTGAQIIDPAILNQIPDRTFSLNRAWDLLARDNRLAGLVYDGAWCDVGRPEGIALAEALLTDVRPQSDP